MDKTAEAAAMGADPVDTAVGQIEAQAGMKMGAALMKVADENLGTLLDLKA